MRNILLLSILGFVFSISSLRANSHTSESSDSDIVRYLQEEYGVKFTDNNRLVLFKSGSEKFADLFSAVRQARHSIHLEYFNFRNDSISK